MKQVPEEVRAYLAAIGRNGGAKSRRHLSAETARDMVRVREARKIFRQYHAQCFWSMRPDLRVTIDDIPELARGLRQNGGRQGFLLAAELCR